MIDDLNLMSKVFYMHIFGMLFILFGILESTTCSNRIIIYTAIINLHLRSETTIWGIL